MTPREENADLLAEITALRERVASLTRENIELQGGLTEARHRETATGDILRVIASSPTDLQPAFDVIASNALRLCNGVASLVFRYDGTLIHLAASGSAQGIDLEVIRHKFPAPPEGDTFASRVVTLARPLYIADIGRDPDAPLGLVEFARANGFRSIFAAPMRHEDQTIGLIAVIHRDVGGFTPEQGALLKTFADQAVIAIENARLFTELQEKNQALTDAHAQTTEALDQQTATSEILRVISQSPTDVQPVFETIVRNASIVCGAFDAAIFIRHGDRIYLAAHQGPIQAHTIGTLFALSAATVAGHAILDARPIHVDDLSKAADYPEGRTSADEFGYRTTLAVPLAREAAAVGALLIRRNEVRPFSDQQIAQLQTFADQAVIAIENVRLFKELEARNHELTDALERETATGEILRVISGSPTDVQPVFDAIAESVRRLCRGTASFVCSYNGELIHLVAVSNLDPEAADAWHQAFPRPPSRATAIARAILTREVAMIPDVLADPEYALTDAARTAGFRSGLAVPMLREGKPIGGIAAVRGPEQPEPFSPNEIELLQTFADQAVIAIENVRLFNETKEALERQTATAEILRVISESPTNVQPVFDMIAVRATTLCGAELCIVQRLDGEQFHLAAIHGADPESVEVARKSFPMTVSTESGAGRAMRARGVVHLADVLEDPTYALKEQARAMKFRSGLAVPMLREGHVIGVIVVMRSRPGYFAAIQVELLKAFADQAVIAIENVRLFTELQEKNEALTAAHAQVTAALEQQTATAEILRVISSSPTDIQPVFDAIAESSVRLCKADYGSANRLESQIVHLVAQHGQTTQWLEAARRLFPHPLTRDLIAGGAMLDREIVHLHDLQSDTRFPTSRSLARTMGYRTALSVPMLRDNAPLGAIVVFRQEDRPFSEAEIGLLRTFADQAVIAIENVRLFTELQARTQELTRSVGQLTALGEVARAVSSTLDLEAVLNTIVLRAIQLSETNGGSVYEYDEATEEFSLRASRDLPEAYVEQVRDARPRKGEGAVGRVAQTREPVQIADISDPAAYESRVRNTLLQIGLRALLAVPLIAEDQLVGALIVMRRRSGTFAAEEVTLLQTFATQSALAIQNARLFREIEVKSRQLEVASQHKSEFLANMSHELRTPLNAIIGFSEVLTDRMFGELNEKQEEYLKDIYASGTHLLSLINDILDLSKIEAGRMELELSDFDLPTALDNALMLVRERAQRRSLTLHKSVAAAGVGVVRADERKIRQVVLNLLSNAIKFTPEGGRVEVAVASRDGSVEVSVSDTGIGIAPEDQEKVFEEFRQVGTAEKKAEGTGLGLTLCRKFVELHGGRIWVKSEVGLGSTFSFTIPVH